MQQFEGETVMEWQYSHEPILLSLHSVFRSTFDSGIAVYVQ